MPPAIIAGAIAIGASAAYAAGYIALTTALIISTTATVAGALLTKVSVPSLGNYTSQQDRKQVLRSSAAPKNYIYGKTKMSGVMFFAEEQAGDQTDKEWLHIAIAVCAHEVNAILAVYLGDDDISTYGEYAQYQVHNNSTDVSDMLSRAPSWKPDMIGQGICWVRLSLKFNQEKFPSGLPNITFLVEGKKVYDPRSGLTQYSNNAALCILDYYRDYLKVPDSELLMEEFIEAANLCDETINGNSYSEPRYTINGVFDASEAVSSTLDDLHLCCAGEPTYIGGKHGLLVGAYYGPATMVLDESQIVEDIKIVPETPWNERINIVQGTFIDPEQGYTEVDYPAVKVDAYIIEDGAEFTTDQKYRFVTSEFQAQRLAQITINRKRLGRTMDISLNFAGYPYRPGRYVKINIPQLGIAMEEFRVTKWALNPNGTGIKITVRQENADVWGDAVGKPIDRPDLTNLPGPNVPAPTNVQFVPVASNAEVNYQGELSWVNPTTVDFTQIIIQGNGKTVVSQQSTETKIQINGLDRGVTYTAYLRNSAKAGILSNVATLQFVLAIDSKYYGDIYANNGYFKGVIYANNIVGDVYNKMAGSIPYVNVSDEYGSGFPWASNAGEHVVWSIPGEEFDRTMDSNLYLTLTSSQRQYFTILMRAPGLPDQQVAYVDTGNGGENSPAVVQLNGITVPATDRDTPCQLVCVVGENRSSGASFFTPLAMQTVKADSGSGSLELVGRTVREVPWVALYKKGRTPIIPV